MRPRYIACVVSLLAALPLDGIELQRETKSAWQEFVASLNSRIEHEALQPDAFLEVDRSPELRATVRGGEVVVAPVGREGDVNVPGGVIHDWIGSIFIPRVTGRQVINTVRSYDRYSEFYKPLVLQAHKILNGADACGFSILLQQKVLFVDTALDGQYTCSYTNVASSRWYSITTSTRMCEIRNYAHRDARSFPPDMGDGFIWRLHSLAKYEEAEGGVYVELEAAALSRPIPASLRWMVSGVVERISRAALATSLRQTREAAISSQQLVSGR